MTEFDVQTIAQRVLGASLHGAGFDAAHVEARPNSAGEDALFITVRFKPGAGVTGGGVTGEAMVALGHALEAAGEHRFPYLIYAFPDDPPPYSDDVQAAE